MKVLRTAKRPIKSYQISGDLSRSFSETPTLLIYKCHETAKRNGFFRDFLKFFGILRIFGYFGVFICLLTEKLILFSESCGGDV